MHQSGQAAEMIGQHAIEEAATGGRQPHLHGAAISRSARAFDEVVLFQSIEQAGDGRPGDAAGIGDAARGEHAIGSAVEQGQDGEASA
jgi:hypothetical protein